MIRLKLSSILGNDQQKALRLSTAKPGFPVRHGIPTGPIAAALVADTRGNLIPLFQPQH